MAAGLPRPTCPGEGQAEPCRAGQALRAAVLRALCALTFLRLQLSGILPCVSRDCPLSLLGKTHS